MKKLFIVVLAFFTFKDGKVYTHETGASNLPK